MSRDDEEKVDLLKPKRAHLPEPLCDDDTPDRTCSKTYGRTKAQRDRWGDDN